MSTKELLLAEIDKLNDVQIEQVYRHALRLARWQVLAADKRCILEKLQDIQFDGPEDLSRNLDHYLYGHPKNDD